MLRRMAARFIHTKARTPVYQGGVARAAVPDDKVPWSVPFPEYAPVDYTAPVVLAKPVWADLDFTQPFPEDAAPKYNEVQGKVDRTSFEGKYDVVNNIPLNPFGRTGMKGRGLLGRWGPNHAADPVVTRWKRDDNNNVVVDAQGKKVLEFVAIQRKDTGEWAIPGGMVEPGDTVSLTLKKEFGEEALNSLEAPKEELEEIHKKLDELFAHGVEVYKGYVDDPRNTDNAWMETVAVNFHDEDGSAFTKFKLHAGDDAGAVCWIEFKNSLEIYANHKDFLKKVAELRNAAQ